MANVLGELFQDIADSIRAKTGDTATMKPAEFPDKIAAIETGGGEVDERVKYVTFRNVANTELIGMRSYTFTSASTDGVLTSYIRGDEGYFNIQSLVQMINRSNISIILDGEVHFLTVTVVSDSAVYFGNLALDSAGADTGESLLMSVGVDEDNLVRFFIRENATSASHNIGVYKYVTELITYPVVSGDTVHDPVTKGYVSTPTKESTAQYNYTHGGWSLTPNGSVNSSALSNVTEDRVVYAAFTSSVRYYTITYYDSDGTTVLKTESFAYGSTPAYMPEKNGASFDGWNPSLATVTGDASYQAKWLEKITFAGASWDDIAEISERGEAAQYFAVGDTKDIVLTRSDGTTETIQVAIAGFNHDTLEDGSNKAGISIVCLTVPDYTTTWSLFAPLWKSGDSSGQYYGRYLNASSGYGYDSYVRSKLNNTVFTWLPDGLQNVIKPVLKSYDVTYNSGTSAETQTTKEKLWALSLTELGDNGMGSGAGSSNTTKLGSRYELFTYGNIQNGDTLTAIKVSNGQYCDSYWTRSAWRGGSGVSPHYIERLGNYSRFSFGYTQDRITTNRHLRFGFCV